MITEKMTNISGFFAFAMSSGTAISSYNDWLQHFDDHGTSYGFLLSVFVAMVHLIFKWLHYRRKTKTPDHAEKK